MRLVTRLLTAALLAVPAARAQERPRLPWEGVPALPWLALHRPMPEKPSAPLVASDGPLSARVTGDGTLRVVDARGLVRLEQGLPGRPLHAWRDGGLPLPTATGQWGFPEGTPLSQGFGTLQWCAEDFRPFLRGLLWVLEDGEAFLAAVHPATGRAIFLPLPPGRDFGIRFLPEGIEVTAGRPEPGAATRWFLPWMGLLPRLAALGPRSDPAPRGTAMTPFPKE